MTKPPICVGDISASTLREAIHWHARCSLAEPWDRLSTRQIFECVSLAVRDLVIDTLIDTERRYEEADAKRVYYVSIEYLLGRSLASNLCNLGLYDVCAETLREMGVDLESVEDCEADAALGTGGLGRLAACFLDSLATLDMPGYGYGINYEYGVFQQRVEAGYQREKPDNWRAFGTRWQIERPEEACSIPVYGRIEGGVDRQRQYNPMWLDWRLLTGVPCDMPVVGYGGRTVNVLRLFSARASREFDIGVFNEGDYLRAVEQKFESETISKVLYPSTNVPRGQELRLLQEYFLAACSIRDIVRRYERRHRGFEAFSGKVAIHLNDTHPALAIVELMRLLIDERDLPWNDAWEITRAATAYTNHTLLPEALEKWPSALLERVVPRHLQIIYEIDRRLTEHVASVWPGDRDRLARMSIVEEGPVSQVRMAHLSIAGSHSVNGVSALHTRLLETTVARDFHALWPERFNNKTNGVTPRRWLLLANPELSRLITDTIGDRWITALHELRALEPWAADPAFRDRFMAIKRRNKERLARVIADTTGVRVDPASLFDVQIKRIHEYKRQLLNLLRIVHDYLCLVDDGTPPPVPRTYVFAGKAMPEYWAAKQIIKAICSVASVVNADPRADGHLKVAFIPDYRVSLAERIIPAADLSEQISTAGTEASGTGNMKLAMNGALTIGTLDGATVEMLHEIGAEHMFTFGLTAAEVQALRHDPKYQPREICRRHPCVQRVFDALASSLFCANAREPLDWIVASLVDRPDPYVHAADLPTYIDAQGRAGRTYLEPAEWAAKAVLNVARMGRFSIDRAVEEYARDIWAIEPVAAPAAPVSPGATRALPEGGPPGSRDRDVEIGSRIQQTLLVGESPKHVPGLTVGALAMPSESIDGDFYQFFEHEDQCLDLMVADVMGKGIPAALLGAATKNHFFKALCHLLAMSRSGRLPEPREIVTLAHAEMARQLMDLNSFVTLCYGRFDLNERLFRFVDCGHTGIIRYQAATGLCDRLHGDNLPLGVRAGEVYEQTDIPFERDDVLLFYSDGITEARNAGGDLYGLNRLMDAVRLNAALAPGALVEAIRAAVVAFAGSSRLSDDLTCVAVRIGDRAVPSGRAELEIRSDLRDLPLARQFVRVMCRNLPGAPLDESSIAALELAVHEATSNVVKHAYHGRPGQWLQLEAEAFDDRLSIRLYHRGDPFDPAEAPPPAFDGSRESGFGVYLIRHSVDEVRCYRDERGRNCIALSKYRSA